MSRRLLGFALALMVACAWIPALAAKKAGVLKPTQKTSSFVIERDTSFDIKLGIGAQWRWGLHAGTFTASFENDEGVFYEGSGTPVIAYLGDHSMGDYAGGVFVPNATPDKPYLYYYFKPDESTYRRSGAIVAWMIKSGTGKINFFPYKGPLENPAFLATLKSSFRSNESSTSTAAGSP